MPQFTNAQLAHFRQYERVRTSGRFNMFTQARAASAEARLTMDEYFFVMSNFTALKSAALAGGKS